jgi:hypothetical protein
LLPLSAFPIKHKCPLFSPKTWPASLEQSVCALAILAAENLRFLFCITRFGRSCGPRAAARARGHSSTAPVAQVLCPFRQAFFTTFHGTAGHPHGLLNHGHDGRRTGCFRMHVEGLISIIKLLEYI